MNKVQRSANTNFFVYLFKERLDGQPLLLLLFVNNLTAVPDTKDDIFALRCFLRELTRNQTAAVLHLV